MYGMILFVAPFVIGIVLGRFTKVRSDWGRAGLAILCATLPFLWLLVDRNGFHYLALGTGEALGTAPAFILISLIPAGLGVHLGNLARPVR